MSRAALLAALAMSCGLPGCADPNARPATAPGQKVDRSLIKDDIYKVVCSYQVNMWQSYDQEGDRNPEGFKFTLFLLSKATGKGALADGLIRVSIYVLGHDEQGRPKRDLAQRMSWSTADLACTPEPSRLGYAYVPYVYWGDVDLLGRDVEITVQYESPSGRLVQAQTKHVRVPARKD